jgi:hypothetical protein
MSLLEVPELAGATLGERSSLGALLTHEDLAALDPGAGPLERSRRPREHRPSCHPRGRNARRNLCAAGFREAELSAALLALDAEVEVVSPAGTTILPLDTYLDTRPAGILSRAHVPCPAGRRSAYRRLTVLRGSEYPVCGVATSSRSTGRDPPRPRRRRRGRRAPPPAHNCGRGARRVDAVDEAAVLAAGRAGAPRNCRSTTGSTHRAGTGSPSSRRCCAMR